MSLLTRFKFFLWAFGRFRVPLIGALKPRLVCLTDQSVVIKIPLTRRSKNHLQSMYFGALAVGADLAGGLHGYYYAKRAKVPISLVFKSFQAQFLQRPESDVYFVCDEGELVQQMITDAMTTRQRINQPLRVNAYTNYPHASIEIARFSLELSLKIVEIA